MTAKGHEVTFWGGGNILYIDSGGSYMTMFVKTHRTIHQRMVNFATCKSYLYK